ncbi:MAG: hypothetical protein U0W24_07190 [Bacteroidales bacterium]
MKSIESTRKQNEKMYQFVKLCTALTKQGFKFTRQNGVAYALTFEKVDAKRLLHPETRLPFVNSIIRIAGDKIKECYQFEQWAGR